MDQCITCRFFKYSSLNGPQYGQCMRFPQVVEKHVADGCGEYKAQEPVKLKEPAKSTKGT